MRSILKFSIFLLIFLICRHSNFTNPKLAAQTELGTKQARASIQQTKPSTKPENILSKLKHSISFPESYFAILLFSFLSGIVISFTPCVYPMIPVTASILQTQATTSVMHNFLSSLCYVLGLAIVYACLGFISATTSIIFGQWTASPFFIFFIILLFLFLAFSLFGFYEIRIPQFLIRTHDTTKQGSLIGSFLFGFFSGAIASPCITPALAALLTLVADKGSPMLGFFALFFFAFGMGTLLIIIGTISSTLNALPRSGKWMLEVKNILGFLMLAMCIYFLKPLISVNIYHLFYLLLVSGVAVYYLVKIVLQYRQPPTSAPL